MVRNSKRRAFTIVELVIVIAVIAILAAVMIPTFGGVIESANVSADKQILSTVNSQIAIYTGLGNKIETEADLWKALKGDFNGGSDMTKKFDPRSAKHGYHYWYNGATQTVELLCVEDLENNYGLTVAKGLGRMVVYADDDQTRENAPIFAESSPRAFINGKIENGKNLYFLDYVTDEEGKEGNDFSKFFFTLENLSKDDLDKYEGKYAAALKIITDIAASNRDANKQFAAVLAERMAATVILTNKPAIVGGANEITHVYIPENKNLDENKNPTQDYYLNHTNTADIKGKTDVDSVVVIPENVKLGDGCLDAFNDVTIRVDVATGTEIPNILNGGAVSEKAEIVISTGDKFVIVGGNEVWNKNEVGVEGKTSVATLTFKNYVTSFAKPTVTNDSAMIDAYIALAGIKNGLAAGNENGIKLDFNIDGTSFKGEEGNTFPLFTDVTWTIDGNVAGVSIDENGVVKFTNDFNAGSFTVRATAKAVKDGEVGYSDKFDVTVLTLSQVKTKLNGKDVTLANENGTWALKADESIILAVATDIDNTTVKTAAMFSNEYTYWYNGIEFDKDQLEKLGATPEVTISTGDTYFNIINSATCNFKLDGVKALNGGIGSESVTLTVKDGDGSNDYTANTLVKVKDNTNIPYAIAIPTYNATESVDFDKDGTIDADEEVITYRYRVGNATTLAFSEIFALKNGMTVGDYTVFVYNAEPMGDGYFNNNDFVEKFDLKTTTDLDFSTSKFTASETQTYYLVLGVEEVDQYGKQKVYAPDASVVEITIVDKGINVTKKDEFTTPADGQSIVLHNDLSGFAAKGDAYLTLNGGSIYGNYFTVNADQYYDTDAMANKKYSFIEMNNGSINQFILDGPVYPKQVAMSKDLLADTFAAAGDGSVYFCFGIKLSGTKVTIEDSYLSHFNAPVMLWCGTLEANNTVFEGGGLANIYIRQSLKELNLTDVQLIQNTDGYTTTLTSENGTVHGMGIFVHEDQTTNLAFNFVNVEQYNWIDSADSQGAYTSLVISNVYDKNYTSGGRLPSSKTSVALKNEYSAFGHSFGEKFEENEGIKGSGILPSYTLKPVTREKQYLNAAIAAVNKTASFTVTSKNADGSIRYTYADGEGAAEVSSLAGDVWVSTYECTSVGSCCSSEKVNYTYSGTVNGVNYDGADYFRASVAGFTK